MSNAIVKVQIEKTYSFYPVNIPGDLRGPLSKAISDDKEVCGRTPVFVGLLSRRYSEQLGSLHALICVV